MATNLFSKAAAYRKKHPGMTMPEAVKACSKGAKSKKAKPRKKAAAKKKVHHKKAAPRKRAHKKAVGKVKRAAPKKAAKKKTHSVKIKRSKKGVVLSISGVSMSKIAQEHTHQRALESSLHKHQTLLKQKGHTAGEKNSIRRDIAHYKSAITASKKHVSVLKRAI